MPVERVPLLGSPICPLWTHTPPSTGGGWEQAGEARGQQSGRAGTGEPESPGNSLVLENT